MTENAKSNKESNATRPGLSSRRLGTSRFGSRSSRLLGSDSDSTPPVSPKKAERRPLRVEFALMEDEEKTGSVNSDTDLDLASVKQGNSRLRNPRLSLLGKPLNYRQHKRDVRYRRLQTRIYNFLERPKAWLAWWYHLAVFMVVILCLVLSVLVSISEFELILSPICLYLEVAMFLWIVGESSLRLWSAGCRSRYQGFSGRMKFMRRPQCLIDCVLLIATIISLIAGSTQDKFAAASISGLRFFQILRMVRMDRRGGTWKLLGSVVWAHRQVTLCTVGYGDVVPTTWGGKVIASVAQIICISFFALPAGILGSGFALKVQQQQRQKHLNRRRIPAAQLIQCLWRCYAADEHSMSVATWKPHMVPCPSPTFERPWKNNTSFVSRFSTRRRDRSGTNNSQRDGTFSSSINSPMIPRHLNRKFNGQPQDDDVPDALNMNLICLTDFLRRSHLSLATGLPDQRSVDQLPVRKENSMTSISKESEDEPDLSPRYQQLTDVHKCAIRSLRKIRYFVARRKFREALRPYDVKDVIEQYSAGHVDMLGRVKNLQCRLDQILGKAGSKNKDVYESKQSLASRIVKVERSVEDIECKLDTLVDMYQDDRRLLLQYISTQNSQPDTPSVASSPLKPRPILVDKLFTSEPATPTGSTQNPLKPMQRNLSDLSQRIKKRVTYRCLSLNDPPHNVPHTKHTLCPPGFDSDKLCVSGNSPPGVLLSPAKDPPVSCLKHSKTDYSEPRGEMLENVDQPAYESSRSSCEDSLKGCYSETMEERNISETSSLLENSDTGDDVVFSFPLEAAKEPNGLNADFVQQTEPTAADKSIKVPINEHTLDFHIKCDTTKENHNIC
ncbi:potassium voltage-gated channel subfamily KQT member 1-like [Gigantopelta aegis]|uniref:potassium voltage-gated channel subfamily KQT member 1-like n=1 Tax=Gigantopelta aegis TaxID=1735272 RepID=UPI001B8886D9|nr:potassium voltage-gated channel subfamily KQT member 1-like [Gigantopelta aegis]